MTYKTIIAIMSLLLITGCTIPGFGTGEVEETKISPDQGIGVLEFKAVANTMLADNYNYILLSIRNNAAGSSASNIKASLENVNPFSIYECNQAHDPSENRLSVCNQFFDDINQPYKAHKVNEMIPNEEIQFFWNVKAPTNMDIVGMQYGHTMYYILEYDYISTVTQTIAAISNEEFLEQSQEGPVTISGQTISSPGEIKIESKTQQPLIYSEGSADPLEFMLEFEVDNSGRGVPKPGTKILIAVKNDSNTIAELNNVLMKSYGWIRYEDGLSCDWPGGNDLIMRFFGPEEWQIACNDSWKSELAPTLQGVTVEDGAGNTVSPVLTSSEWTRSATITIHPRYPISKLRTWFDTVFDPIEFIELSANIRKDLLFTVIDSNDLSTGNYALALPMKMITENVYEPQKILTVSAYISYTYQKEGSTSISVYPKS